MIHSKKQDKRVALVTGAGRRMGSAIASYLQQQGFAVIVHCFQSQKEAEVLVAAFNASRPKSGLLQVADLMDADAMDHMVQDSIAAFGRLDLLVNNASLFIASPGEIFDAADWQRLLAIHVHAPYYLSQGFLPHLKASRGSIVNITDRYASKPLKNYGWYCQSKAALMMQTQVLARAFAPEVRVNAVAPGSVLWPEGANALSDKKKSEILEQSLLKRPDDGLCIAQAVWMLAENEFISGETITVDGGRALLG